ncbi:MAG: prenyltransferase [Defluviitaleaceae bacterium]|nr:prenyltransferase [Defluviitaleaceae bacterium]
MEKINKHQHDIDRILSRRHDLGADWWTTPDKRLNKGSPFSTGDCAIMLLELGMEPEDPILSAVANLFFGVWRKDGRFKLSPSGGILPCHTAYAASLLCRLGYAKDERIQTTLHHFLETPYTDGGWRCNKFSFGRGPETNHSNPLPTLNVLDAFRFTPHLNKEPKLNQAVEFLLSHWRIRKPIGPCQYGIGKLFMQIEYPLWGYSLLPYVYILSFYEKAQKDERFQEAYEALKSKLINNQITVERNSPRLKDLDFCKKGQPNEQATQRFIEIKARVERGVTQ